MASENGKTSNAMLNFFNPLLPVLVDLVYELADKLVNGKNLNAKEKKILLTAYVILVLWGKEVVNKTSTDVDNKLLKKTIELCEETAEEADIKLPVLE